MIKAAVVEVDPITLEAALWTDLLYTAGPNSLSTLSITLRRLQI